MDEDLGTSAAAWKAVRTTWMFSAVLVLAVGLGLPLLLPSSQEAGGESSSWVPPLMLILAAGDVIWIILLVRLARRRAAEAGATSAQAFVAAVGGLWLVIAVLPDTAAILGALIYVMTRDRFWLNWFFLVGIVAVVLSRPSLPRA